MSAPPPRIASALCDRIRDFQFRVCRAVDGTGAVQTSWYRDPLENEAAGGEEHSQHLVGLAIDLVAPDPELVADRARREGLVAIVEPDHVHIQALPAAAAIPIVEALA